MPILFFIAALFLSSCASFTTVQLDNVNLPITAIQKVALKSLPQGKQKISSNLRIFTSKFFIPSGKVKDWPKPKRGSRVRYYAIVTIFGDRRPYDINVEVVRQTVVKSMIGERRKFSDNGSDKRLAKILLEYINELLIQSRRDLNIIDDFRVF